MAKYVDVERIGDFERVKKQLESRWLELETTPNAFRYKLNIQRQKVITNGPYKVLVQLNVERSTQRRPPQQITSIAQPFDASSFNFNKVNDCEILIKCNYRLHPRADTNALFTFLINSSPLTRYHSLICPSLSDNLSQILTEQSIRFAVDVLRGFDDNCYRIGFNSLGALASVNHLHMHLMHIETDLFIENVELSHVVGNVHRLAGQYPVLGFCFLVRPNDNVDAISADMIKLVDYFCANRIPHNVFWTFAPHADHGRVIKIFVYPRAQMSDKIRSEFNVAFCELSGYVPTGDIHAFETMTGETLTAEMLKAMGATDNEHLIAEIVKLYSQ